MKSLSISLFLLLINCLLAFQQDAILKNAIPQENVANVTQLLNNLTNTDLDKCGVCEAIINVVLHARRSGYNRDSMVKLLKELCPKYTDWGVIACNSYVDIEIDTVLFIIDNKQNLTAKRVCSINLQENNCVDPDAKKWVIPLPPEPTKTRKKIENDSQLKILHLTDIHYDPLYKPNSNAKCEEPLCCHNGTPTNSEDAAGFWGDYNVCDMPWHSITSLINYIKTNYEKIDFVYFTGDIISHTWLTTKEQNIESIREIYKLFRDSFNIPVYPILGNHEPHPTNFYSPEKLVNDSITTHWVFNVVAEEWSKWLPQSTTATLLKGGYYSVVVKPGFRIIALNSNVCYIHNLWLNYDDEDPYEQLKWLVEQLTEAELNNENVHILSHIPPGEIGCHKQWSNQFRRIVNRFARTISAQFNGHTHFDEIRFFYNLTNSNQVINVAFNGGSFTTFVGLNPNFRFYTVESTKYTILDYDQYTFNITKANENPTKTPQWYKLYSFKDAYGLSELSLDNFGKLIKDMTANESIVQQYYRFLVRDSDVMMKQGCNQTCLQKTLCTITAVETSESILC